MSQRDNDIRRFYRNSKSDKVIRAIMELFLITEAEARLITGDCHRIKMPHYGCVGKMV